MMKNDWHYDPATDFGLSFLDRLRPCPREPDAFVYAARTASAIAIRAALRLYNRLEIVGRNNLPKDRSYIIVSNHASHMDTAALLSALPLRNLHHTYPLAARDYFDANPLRLALTAIIANVMLFDRDANGRQCLQHCKNLLEENGNVLIIFPEGTRTLDNQIGRFRRGIGLLVAGKPFPVVPCYLEGTFEALPKRAFIPRPSRVRLAIGEPRTYEQVEQNDETAVQICAELSNAVLALSSQTQAQTAPGISKEAYQ
jgi:1-acyl-sn-glycerol-3-phosphate acyltransferase